ncbi:amidoligase family protein [Marivita geojedonensis]|uniref:amidoligase family protein n=1 Tax=Marivita geojedonensis TaxID=1123756 RepID=UPI000D451EA6|nr:amidoligase family protein [Marivita geojedonensis]PRY73306.1 putative amidoligase enzyme [Marivita geojedonensis]
MTATATPFPPLPIETTAAGDERLTGIEIEFAGPTELETGKLIAREFGGTVQDDGQHSVTVCDTAFGDIEVELDITLRKRKDLPFLKEGLDAFRGLIPVEVVTPPLSRAQLSEFNTICAALRGIGAMGSRTGVLLGFGVHVNPEVVAPDHRFTLDTITAYALLEPWLRRKEQVDTTRRMMPFVGAWPRGLISELANTRCDSLAEVMQICARHIASRNQSLDLLPLFKHAEPELFSRLFDTTDKTSARPTFHFRLPDSRIDEADWSLLQPWQLWRQVELVAANPDLLSALRSAWRTHDAAWFERKSVWVETIDGLLSRHNAKADA